MAYFSCAQFLIVPPSSHTVAALVKREIVMSEQLEQQAQEEQQVGEWVRQQFQKANEHLASKGVLPENVAVSESRYLPPLLAIWKITAQSRQQFWVISGNLPTDHLPLASAADAREAVRAFSLHWQLKAAQITDAGNLDQTKLDFVNLLIHRAESLYELFEREDLWAQQA